jgi:hypothetical protein
MPDQMKNIGKVKLDLRKNDMNDEEYVILSPDDNQTLDNQQFAKEWIVSNFQNDSKIKTGIISFPIKDWKTNYGKRFVKLLSSESKMISWRDVSKTKSIMKGLISGDIHGPENELLGTPPPKPEPPGGEVPVPAPPESQPKPTGPQSESRQTFREYIDRLNKTRRKSGISRRIGIKSLLGNPRLNIPETPDDEFNKKIRYKDLDGKLDGNFNRSW